MKRKDGARPSWSARTPLSVGVLALLMLGAAALYLRHSLFKTLIGLTKRTRGLAEGDLETDISGLGRNDELGDTASALEHLRVKLKSAEAVHHDAVVQGAAFQASHVPMVILDSDFRITHCNRACRDLARSAPDVFAKAIPGGSADDVLGHAPNLDPWLRVQHPRTNERGTER